jgi:PsbP-like protein
LALDGLGNHTGAITYLDKALAIDRTFKEALNFKSAILDRNTIKFLKYENFTYGIKMEYPPDWRVEGASNSSTVASLYPQGDNASYALVQIKNLSRNYTPDQYLNSLMRGDAADHKYFPDIRFNQNTTNNIILAGHPGYLLNGTFRDPTSDALQKFTNVGTVIGDKAYSVIYYSPAYTYRVYLPTFNQIIKSFEVIPQKN